MNLAPTPDQQAVMDQARRFLAEQVTRERRLAWDDEAAGCDAAFWQAVADLGWLGYGLPETPGGQGASLLELGLLIEECGRAAAPGRVFAAITGGLALAALGSAAQRRLWLPAIACGRSSAALAVAEKDAADEPAAFQTTIKRRAGALRLDGEKRFVPQGEQAAVFLVLARDGRGASAVLVPSDTKGVKVSALGTLAKDRQSVVTFRDVVLPASALAGKPGSVWPRWLALRTRLAMLLCAEAVGGAQAALDMTVAHVCDREQFGAKLGTFQAVQQMAAVMAIDLEGARHLTRQALWLLAEGRKADREVAIAKAWTGRAYRDVTVLAHQLHGGAGYVVEHDLHRHTLRAKAAELTFGSTEQWLDTLADQLRLVPATR
jgi:alkylation response protein AidB-like acyl-CoA dehydrogenase